MADATRGAKLEEVMNMIHQVIVKMDVKFGRMSAEVAEISSTLVPETSRHHPSNSLQLEASGGSDRTFQTQTTRLEFSRFDGADPSGWLYRAE